MTPRSRKFPRESGKHSCVSSDARGECMVHRVGVEVITAIVVLEFGRRSYRFVFVHRCYWCWCCLLRSILLYLATLAMAVDAGSPHACRRAPHLLLPPSYYLVLWLARRGGHAGLSLPALQTKTSYLAANTSMLRLTVKAGKQLRLCRTNLKLTCAQSPPLYRRPPPAA